MELYIDDCVFQLLSKAMHAFDQRVVAVGPIPHGLEYEWCKGAMLNFSHLVFIRPLLLLLVQPELSGSTCSRIRCVFHAGKGSSCYLNYGGGL